LLTTNETGVFENLFFLLFLTSQIGKSVNDNAEDQIENDDDDDEKEQKIVNNTSKEQWLLMTEQTENITTASLQVNKSYKC